MGFFGMLFWIAVLWLVIRAWRRSSCLAINGPRDSGRYGGWYDSSEFYTSRPRRSEVKRRERPHDQQAYIDSLETRVSELEERLDFTERLLAGRQQRSNQP
jgi:hypothetical protein